MQLSPLILDKLTSLEQEHRPTKDRFFETTEDRRSEILESIVSERGHLIQEIGVAQDEGPLSQSCLPSILREIDSYAARNDWTILDGVALACCSEWDAKAIGQRLAFPMLLFQAIRMVDDGVDKHHDYKGAYSTALGVLEAEVVGPQKAEAVHWLCTALLLVFAAHGADREGFRFVRTTLHGMLIEILHHRPWTLSQYQEMATAKMVNYGMLIYEPIVSLFEDGERASLEDFVRHSLYVSQLANDFHDIERDREAGQPNFWSLEDLNDTHETAFLREFEALSRRAVELQGHCVNYGSTRVADLARYALEAAR